MLPNHSHRGPGTPNQFAPSTPATGSLTNPPPPPPPSYFTADEIKVELLRKQSVMYSPLNSELYPDIPEQVDNYRELTPLENPVSTQSTTFGYVNSVYRAVNMWTGDVYCLRRVHGFQPNTSNFKSLSNSIDAWKKLEHANVVPLRQVFTTKAFGDNSLIFVYDYFPGAQTLMSQFFTNHHHGGPGGLGGHANGLVGAARPYSQQQSFRAKLLPEPLIWTIIIQLSSALRTIHANGLACRVFDPTKIIITSGQMPDNSPALGQYHPNPRLRLSSCGIFDVISPNPFQELAQCNPKVVLPQLQQEDLIALGKVLLALSCNSLNAVERENWPQSLELIARNYSTDLRTLVLFLLTVKRGNNINEIMPMIGGRFYAQLDTVYSRYDVIENQLAKEIDNGRLFRLLCKLGTINERPEYRMDPQWSETGDRYLLKLFRDYLFHQVSEDGHPWIDMGHIVSTLNKLDAGSQEKICLVSRDDQNVLIVSFAELKKCCESAFNELLL
ncbi:PAN2-PAN3 deadenylation complex subunit pan3 [Tetranychus urticae]|uniref:PAN2-PAN3 deadenylation complex subunit pan3 n=1 Tax=Tetranychus urticae TaxID=32264 RepID=UPI00077BECE5|nr:PAN2-PAN3 deadenylation complex subunit pan3 [Tetranychus urticae]XP_015795747.1 PAN2-PAN3 deadenylation complex subunit pan3 [Tetranychus urticae]XP_015795748.1 PAN2-PAN3 deadenylation complex subunit pan3 [Tetranychus urticae]XP_015795749.1 PAN2-PAN3 deadenylation complex subunit pan3 [Tetranychus urticae]XP_015795750.1 PAN2-PAN3 deadenylation complex subunit pan3 [Tetranychus urticae]XP_015795751.1 PAN2-PAN3 deadenylation complex subunit pan3 [Tetranychus urticae]XP_025015988.1 PAN2-PAN